MTWVLGVILLFLVAAIGLLVYVVMLLRQAFSDMRQVLIATRPLPPPGYEDSGPWPKIDEKPVMDSAASVQFWRKIHESNEWGVLAHLWQVKCRDWLSRSRMAADQKNQSGVQFYVGAAWVASQAAVMPSVELTTAVERMKNAETQRMAEEELAKVTTSRHR
jgi:hypothetical protein